MSSINACRIFSNVPAQVVQNANQDGPFGKIITFNQVRFDTDEMRTPETRITIKTPGIYLIGANISFDQNVKRGIRGVLLVLNGSKVIAEEVRDAVSIPTDQVNTVIEISTVYAMGPKDYVEVAVHQQNPSQVPINVVHSPEYSPEFWACRIA